MVLSSTRLSFFSLFPLAMFGCSSQETAPRSEPGVVEASAPAPGPAADVRPLPNKSGTGPVVYTKIGIVTMDAKPWALEENYRRLESYVREAARRGAEVVVAPEAVLDGYVCYAAPGVTRERMMEVAQSLPDGPYIVRARRLSRELGIYLVFGFLERSGQEMFNSLVMTDPQGEILAKYSKVHVGGESYITPGRELKPFDTPLGRIGFLICMDRSVPGEHPDPGGAGRRSGLPAHGRGGRSREHPENGPVRRRERVLDHHRQHLERRHYQSAR